MSNMYFFYERIQQNFDFSTINEDQSEKYQSTAQTLNKLINNSSTNSIKNWLLSDYSDEWSLSPHTIQFVYCVRCKHRELIATKHQPIRCELRTKWMWWKTLCNAFTAWLFHFIASSLCFMCYLIGQDNRNSILPTKWMGLQLWSQSSQAMYYTEKGTQERER